MRLGPAARTFAREQLTIATAIQRAIADADDDALLTVHRFSAILLADPDDEPG